MSEPIATAGITPEFAANAARTWGEAGRAWVESLPEQLREFCERWGLRPTWEPFPLSYNFVVSVERAGTPAVLKLSVGGTDFLGELRALELFGGQGACRVLESDREGGAMLLERVTPGVPLLALGETDESVRTAAGLMRRMRRPAPRDAGLPRLVEWWGRARAGLLERSGGTGEPLPKALVDEATETFAEVYSEPERDIILHGDLHHWNILSSGREGWLAIDPHGALGPPECEIGAFMMNPNNGALVGPDVNKVLGRRLDIFASELGFERDLLARVGFAYGMLSITWSTEDGGDRWRPGLEIVRVLRELGR